MKEQDRALEPLVENPSKHCMYHTQSRLMDVRNGINKYLDDMGHSEAKSSAEISATALWTNLLCQYSGLADSQYRASILKKYGKDTIRAYNVKHGTSYTLCYDVKRGRKPKDLTNETSHRRKRKRKDLHSTCASDIAPRKLRKRTRRVYYHDVIPKSLCDDEYYQPHQAAFEPRLSSTKQDIDIQEYDCDSVIEDDDDDDNSTDDLDGVGSIHPTQPESRDRDHDLANQIPMMCTFKNCQESYFFDFDDIMLQIDDYDIIERATHKHIMDTIYNESPGVLFFT